MLSSLLEGVTSTDTGVAMNTSAFLLCLFSALVLGVILASSYIYKSNYTKSFVVTLAIIPAVVAMIIMMVNGNIGTGVAVAGAFSLIRFRSVPGTAKEIGAIFIGMGAGLAVGMGYIGYAAIFTIILSLISMLYSASKFGDKKDAECGKTLRVTIPEDLDYTNIFSDIFEKFTSKAELVTVKTTNMGSMFRLTYRVILQDKKLEKEMLDQIRCRNGNLEISVSCLEDDKESL